MDEFTKTRISKIMDNYTKDKIPKHGLPIKEIEDKSEENETALKRYKVHLRRQ